MWHVEILAPQPGIRSTPPALEAQSVNHWTAMEVLSRTFDEITLQLPHGIRIATILVFSNARALLTSYLLFTGNNRVLQGLLFHVYPDKHQTGQH